MAVFLDNDQVGDEDMVFDILTQSTAKVIQVGDNSFTVKIGKQEAIVLGNGMIGGVKRIYWDNPVVVMPTKSNSNLLHKLRQIAGII